MSELRQQEIWRRLLGLESHDMVQLCFQRIHGLQLNARRAGEINAAMRQAREYFRNAGESDYSVRPLLTFYGVVCMSRALLLLMNPGGGEEFLTAGHGLQAKGWRNVMKGDIAKDLKNLGDLKIKIQAGMFRDFLIYTGNATLLHSGSSAVTGYCKFDEPTSEAMISLKDLFVRSPDLSPDYASVAKQQYAYVRNLSYGVDDGMEINLVGAEALAIAGIYENLGYEISGDDNSALIRCNSDTVLCNEPPMFVHAYMQNKMGPIPIPDLHLAVPFPSGIRLSQLCITYMMSYALGMLVRYYPTHWITLINGGKGDLLWPTVNRAQQCIESIFPELVAEYVSYVTDNSAWRRVRCGVFGVEGLGGLGRDAEYSGVRGERCR